MTSPGERFHLWPVGRVRSALADLAEAPRQGVEGAPEAEILFEPFVTEALSGIAAGDRVIVLTWLHHANRHVQRVHPRGDPARPEQGVFGTRSSDRPNPIGLHVVEVLEIDGRRMRVSALEALDGTPVLDVKPVLE